MAATKAQAIKFERKDKATFRGKVGHSRTGACTSSGACTHGYPAAHGANKRRKRKGKRKGTGR